MKVGDVVRLWRLNDDYHTREPTDRIGVVVGFSKHPPDAHVFMDGKRERFARCALRVISPAHAGD